MRKLVVAAIITVILGIAWICYWQYDTNRFIEEFQTPLPSKQQVDSTNTKDVIDTTVERKAAFEQARKGNISTSSEEDTLEDDIQSIDTNKDIRDEVDILNHNPIISDIELSPVLKKIFTEIHPFYLQIKEINVELVPLMKESAEVSRRQQEIIKLSITTSNSKKKRELITELNALTQLGGEIVPIIMKLHAEIKPIRSEMEQIILENGFESETEFFNKHEKAYETWTTEQ